MIIDPLASPWRRINAFVQSLLREWEECDFRPATGIKLEGSVPGALPDQTFVAETTFAIIRKLECQGDTNGHN